MASILNFPNILTILRILLIPVFITSILYDRYLQALFIFLAAALTDVLDGYVARSRNQQTQLGAFLDPLADKFMLVSSFIVFSIYGWIPIWLTIIVISRDVVVTTGWVLLYIITDEMKVEPSVPGKTAIALQFVLFLFVLMHINFGLFPALQKPLIWSTAAVTALSGFHYLLRELKVTRERK